MPFANFAAGPCTATYNSDSASGSPAGKGQGVRDLGIVEGVRRWQRTLEALPIQSSAFGATVIDSVYGGGQCFCLMAFKEWNDVIRDTLWPFGASFGEIGQVGRLLSDLAGILTLTAVSDTMAASNGPATITFGKAILSPGHNSEIVLGAEERDIPIVFRCFPYVNSQSKTVWFDET